MATHCVASLALLPYAACLILLLALVLLSCVSYLDNPNGGIFVVNIYHHTYEDRGVVETSELPQYRFQLPGVSLGLPVTGCDREPPQVRQNLH